MAQTLDPTDLEREAIDTINAGLARWPGHRRIQILGARGELATARHALSQALAACRGHGVDLDELAKTLGL